MPDGSQRPAAASLRALRSHPLLALLVLLATVGGSIAYLELREDRYEATAEVLVTPLPVDQQSLVGLPLVTESAEATRVSQTAAALLRSNEAAAVVAERLDGDWDRSRVLESVAVQPRGESNVIAVTATADGPQLAAALANGYARAALGVRSRALERELRRRVAGLQAELAGGVSSTERTELELRLAALRAIDRLGDPTLSLAQVAIPPEESSSPSPVLILAGAIAGGLLLALGAALAAAALDRRIRSEDELAAVFEQPTLARIPDSNRRQARRRAAEAYRTLVAELEARDGPSQVVMVTSGSARDRKTECAVQLASTGREAGRRVVFLDFDMRRSKPSRRARGALFGLSPGDPDLPRLQSGKRLADALVNPHGDSRLAVALAPVQDDPAEPARLGRDLPQFLSEARTVGDLVIVDVPPLGEVGDALRLVDHVDRVLVVARLGVTPRAALESVRDRLRRAGKPPDGLIVIGAQPDSRAPSRA